MCELLVITGESKKPAAVEPVYEFIPEEKQDSRAHIMLGANVAYDRKPEERLDSWAVIMTEANVSYDRKPEENQNSREDVMLQANVENSRAAITTEANPAYEDHYTNTA